MTPAAPAPTEESAGAVLSGVEFGKTLVVLVQLGLAALVIRQFQLESRTFYNVFLLATGAFAIHAVLPLKHRLAFFALVSFAGIALVFGPRNGAMLVAVGLTLIATCHLPVRFSVRVALLLAMTVVLALSRAGTLPPIVAGEVWPILGSMFMFRLAVYLHALKHDPTPPTVARTLAYFFMLPNVCYPLFPVVDYTTFTRTHYDTDASEIHQRGTKWITRGLLHLLLYRFVYLHLSLDVTAIRSLGDVVQAILATFFLYLRVSGQFHLIAGILHLFGFNLPETHRLYYLASSITDYWRRINIYWKDFMMKLAFYPSFFRLRRMGGDRTALIWSTIVVFAATWLLHSYQWFWLRSVFPVTAPDLLFWALLGGLVVVNSLRETKRGRKRTLKADKTAWSASLALRVAGTFTLLAVLWSLWSTESIIDWLWMWHQAATVQPRDLLLIAILLAIGLAIGGVVWDAPLAAKKGPTPWYLRPDVRTTGVLAALLVIRIPTVQDRGGERVAGVLRSLESTALNSRDRALQQKGYYEKLDNRGGLSMQLWNVVQQQPPGLLSLSDTKMYRTRANDFLGYDLQPLSEGVIQGKKETTNRWGMRDRDYTLDKPAGTLRIALTGPSFTMGTGVEDNETYDAYLETKLNEDASAPAHYEVLNFGVAAYSILHQMRMLDDRVYRFHPDVVVLTDGRLPDGPIVSHLTRAVGQITVGAYPELDSILRKAGISDFPGHGPPLPIAWLRRAAKALGVPVRMPEREVALRANTALDDVVAWSFRHMAQEARAHGAVPVFMDGAFPTDSTGPDTPMMRHAREAGFLVVSLADIWNGQPRDEFMVAPWDPHPNARGMQKIADGLYRQLRLHDAQAHLFHNN
ncbi:MAG: SGNH/GDSL hydrolase family protein [bacterium]